MSINAVNLSGKSLLKSENQFGFTSRLLQDTTKLGNFDFFNTANNKLKLPYFDITDEFKIPGFSLEHAEVSESKELEPQGEDNKNEPVATEENSEVNVKVGNNNGRTIIIVGDGNTVNVDELPEPYEGEAGNANGWIDFLKQEEINMVCRDDSGKTQNISGKFETKSFNTNPDEFTITDKSSGEDHVYLYKKVGVDEQGRPLYKCVSMNGHELDDNQYTLVWKEDGTPELVQYSNQDNYGIGLRKKVA